MSVTVAARGDALSAIERHVPALVEQLVASRITAGDATLWGPAAEAEASIRLGWTQAVAISRPLVAEIASCWKPNSSANRRSMAVDSTPCSRSALCISIACPGGVQRSSSPATFIVGVTTLSTKLIGLRWK